MTRLKGLLLLAVMLVCANQMQAQTQMQIEFEKFIEKFPKKEWKDLRNIQRLTMDDLQKYQKVSAAEANRNIWYEEPQFGPNNIYNHAKEKYPLVDIPIFLSAPVIKVSDDKFKSCYRRQIIGCYNNHSPFSPDGTDNEVYAIARLEPFDDVVILVVGFILLIGCGVKVTEWMLDKTYNMNDVWGYIVFIGGMLNYIIIGVTIIGLFMYLI